MKYYNDVLFHNVQKGFIAQTGDPTGTGKGGSSVYGCAFAQKALWGRRMTDQLSLKRHQRP